MSKTPSTKRCRECGADNPPGRTTCWLCEAPLVAEEEAEGRVPETPPDSSQEEGSPFREPAQPPAFVRSEGSGRSFGLDSLFLIVTLAAVLLGILVQAPGLGILFAAAAIPALVRTVVVQSRRKQEGTPMDTGQKVLAFFGSLAVAALATGAALIVFVATCFPIGLAAFGNSSDALFVVAWGVGIILGLAVFALILRGFWRRR